MRTTHGFKTISVGLCVVTSLLMATSATAQPAPPQLPFAGFTCGGGQVNFGFIKGAPFAGIGEGNIFAFIEVPASSSRNPVQDGIYVKNLKIANFTGAKFLWSSKTPGAPNNLTSRFCFRDARTGAPFIEEIPFSQWSNSITNVDDYTSTVSLSKFSKKVQSGAAVLQNISLFVNSTSENQFVLGGEFLISTKTGTVEPDDGIPGDIGCKGAKLCGLANLELLRNRVRQFRN